MAEGKGIVHTFRDTLSTVDQSTGKRVWIFAKMPKGKWFLRRSVFGYALLLFFLAAPFIKMNGHPLLLFDVIHRKFVMFGSVFWPHDFFIFLIGLLTFLVFIFLFTTIFGRLWCGWACPQTIFMELLFRRIEYWIEGDAPAQRKLDKMPWNTEKIVKKGAKHAIFFLISFGIANIFLAYVIGVEELSKIVTESPALHIGGLISIVIFSGAFYGVFAFMREQVCTVICPYGRLQSVMVDDRSLVVAYDYKRGDPKAKWGRNRTEEAGDCIDCGQCVDVCPTGIDIRNGIQLECVNCTACIDACNSVMNKIGKPENLITFASMKGIEQKEKFKMNTRRVLYSALLSILVMGLIAIIWMRSDVQATILRTPGMAATVTAEGNIKNIYNVKILNKTFEDLPVELKLENIEGEITVVGKNLTAPGNDYKDAIIAIEIDEELLKARSTPLEIGVYSNGEQIDNVETNFMKP